MTLSATLSSLLVERSIVLALVASRMAGFVAVAPFPGEHAALGRIGLVVALTLVAGLDAPSGLPSRGEATLSIPMLPLALIEVGCGAAMGLAFRLALLAADVLATMVSQATGLASASVLNPTLGASETALGQIVTLLSLLLVLGLGLHRTALAYLLASFRVLPVGHAMDVGAAAPVLLALAGASIAEGLRLASPVIAVSLLLQATLAMVARAAPALQIFSIGFAALLAAGLGAIALALPDLARGLAEHLAQLPTLLDAVLGAMGE